MKGDLGDLTRSYGTKIWIHDFCAVYMHLLKSPKYAARLLQAKLAEKSMHCMLS